ncbi:MAG: glycosyltransferase family 4 protein [Salaquimonas sp.]
MKRIAFYAPVKPPDHPIPSGDREISRLLIKAMQFAGHDVKVASKYIAYQKRPGAELFATRQAGGEEELEKLLRHYDSMPSEQKPEVWFTYHTYCKAPDYLGPKISSELNIPYVTAEACRTHQNNDTDWASGREIVQASIRKAKRNFCLKPSDKDYLECVLNDHSCIVHLPPFVDEGLIQANAAESEKLPFTNGYPVILAAGMMRPGKKTLCYQMLADALKLLENPNWNLVVVGDGPERAEIENWLSFIAPDRIFWAGLVSPKEVHGLMANSDIFAWPGYKEPIGMVYLEAQTLSKPVAAMASLGVPTVVENEVSGLLSEEGNIPAYAKILDRLIGDETLRKKLGAGGKANIAEHHGIAAAANLISREIGKL